MSRRFLSFHLASLASSGGSEGEAVMAASERCSVVVCVVGRSGHCGLRGASEFGRTAEPRPEQTRGFNINYMLLHRQHILELHARHFQAYSGALPSCHIALVLLNQSLRVGSGSPVNLYP